MSNRSREADTTDHRSDSAGRTDGKLLAPDTRTALRALADRIDERAGALPIGPARHHARRAAVAARGVADEDAQLGARRVAVGELVTELRTAAARNALPVRPAPTPVRGRVATDPRGERRHLRVSGERERRCRATTRAVDRTGRSTPRPGPAAPRPAAVVSRPSERLSVEGVYIRS